MNENAIHWPSLRAAVSLFLQEGEVIELRALGLDRGGIAAGYFSNTDDLLRAAGQLSGECEGIYLTLNPVNPELLARVNNRAKRGQRVTTSDAEVIRRRWLLIDVDPIRPKGISSTNAEQRLALEKAGAIRTFLREEGWPQPIVASSGNGAHILYRIDEPNSPEVRDAIALLLRGLSVRFSDETAHVDAGMFNAARICRLYGTQAKKGDPTEERPHRVARLITVPQEKEQVSLEQIKTLADSLVSGVASVQRSTSTLPPAVPSTPRPRLSGLDIETLDIVAWFRSHECYGRPLSEERGSHAVACPWEADHSGGHGASDTDTVIWDGRDGRLPGFRCLHAHCVQRRIREVLAVWPDSIEFGARQRAGADYHTTDDGNAMRLVDKYGTHIRFCKQMGGWMCWNGSQWMLGESSEIFEQARDVIQDIHREANEVGDGTHRAALVQHAIKSEKWERMKAMVATAAVKRPVQAVPDQFDDHKWLINCLNGTIDLRTGEVHPNRSEDYCAKIVPHLYNPAAVCPRFEQFLLEVFGGDEDLVEYVWRMLGYTLTGSVEEQVLFFCYGSGSNGKSTLLEIIRQLLGNYAGTAAPGLLIQSKGDRHPTEIADLKGKRFVSCVETGEGQRLAEELVKRLTGSDRIKARLMRQDFFEFNPTHKLWLSANHKPVVRGTDYAIWRRIPLIPFEVRFVEPTVAKPGEPIKDPKLLDTLTMELPGILAMAVRAARDWCQGGLRPPARVQAAQEDYRQEQDVLGTFIEDCCAVEEESNERAADVYRVYQRWCKDMGEHCFPSNKFGMAMTDRGIRRFKRSGNWYGGLRLKSTAERTFEAGEAEPLMDV